jgi:uncharacterized protein YqjF (DUF2071 family)
MRRRFPFLTARWSNLAIITYDVDPALIEAHLPPGCEPDTIDGRAFVSLVALDFLDTRVLGLKWPGFVNFPEVNLRIYVRGPDGARGVTFIREMVPLRFVALVARRIYSEPYLAVPMRSRVEVRDEGSVLIEHVATFANREHRIRVCGALPAHVPEPDSRDHFFKEHAWGFGATRNGRLITYEVRHPLWQVYRDPRVEVLDWDFGAAYGDKWAYLGDALPCSVILAVGSEVAVYPKGTTAIEKAAETIDLLHDRSGTSLRTK